MDTIRTNKPVDTVPYGQTVIPQNRLEYLGNKCRKVLQKTPGNVVEVGVYRGGTLIELARAVRDTCPQYKVHGIDTFEGHLYDDGHPVHFAGKYNDVDETELRKTIEKEGLTEWVVLHRGKVEDIFPTLNIENISFAHIDCDLYVPVKYCAEHITPLINAGGMIYSDDYGHEHCPGATKAMDEVFGKEHIHEVALPDGTCWSGYVEL